MTKFCICLLMIIFIIEYNTSCQSTDISVAKENRIEYMEIDGRNCLFSSIGFVMADESLNKKISLSYGDESIDVEKLRNYIPNSVIKKSDDYVEIYIPDGVYKKIILLNNKLASLDQKYDNLILDTYNESKKEGKQIPMVPIFIPRK